MVWHSVPENPDKRAGKKIKKGRPKKKQVIRNVKWLEKKNLENDLAYYRAHLVNKMRRELRHDLLELHRLQYQHRWEQSKYEALLHQERELKNKWFSRNDTLECRIAWFDKRGYITDNLRDYLYGLSDLLSPLEARVARKIGILYLVSYHFDVDIA